MADFSFYKYLWYFVARCRTWEFKKSFIDRTLWYAMFKFNFSIDWAIKYVLWKFFSLNMWYPIISGRKNFYFYLVRRSNMNVSFMKLLSFFNATSFISITFLIMTESKWMLRICRMFVGMINFISWIFISGCINKEANCNHFSQFFIFFHAFFFNIMASFVLRYHTKP